MIEPVVRHIWLTAEQPCGKRLVPILQQWLPYYERRFEPLEPPAPQVGAAKSVRRPWIGCWRPPEPHIWDEAGAAPNRAVCCAPKFRFAPAPGI